MPRDHPARTPAAKSQQLGASPEGTQRFATRWKADFVPDFYRTSCAGWVVSSIALGTYLGDSDDATDARYHAAARLAITSGINILDAAINYRCQRSERVLGRALQELIAEKAVRRDELVICTKAGYVPLDGVSPATREEYQAYLRREYFDRGILRPSDLIGGGHALTSAFLVDQLHRSKKNFGVEHIDVFYVHNPEQQLAAVAPAELGDRLRRAFEALEGCVANGDIGSYGCATWSGLRLPAGSRGHLSLYDLAAAARSVAGDAHHLRVVQLPINLTMSEAVRVSTQRDSRGRLVRVIEAAADLGIDLVASAPLLQGRLTHDLPTEVRNLFEGATDTDRALAFVRGLPGVLTAAVGMQAVEHVTANLAGARRGAG